MGRKQLTLTIPPEVIERMKIRAVKEGRTLSDITEQLYREYLKRPTEEPKPTT